MASTQQQSKQLPAPVKHDISPSGNAFSASVKGASYLILLQLFTRLLTFTFNQLILRYTSPSVFGFATIQLELLSSTILFLSREGFRIALQREQGDIQRTINLAYIPFITGIFGATVGCYGFWRGADEEVKQLGSFGISIVLYGLATVVELFTEPCFAVVQQLLLFRVRTLAEGTAVVVRCAVTYISTISLSQRGQLDEFGALPFGLGQLAYAITLAGVYFFFSTKLANFLPRRVVNKENGETYFFHRPTLWLAFSVTGQSLFKHLLTEGDKIVLTFLTTPYTQGIYAVVSNYGSLVARVFFQPLEETLRTILPRLLSSNLKSLQQASALIASLLKLHILIAIIIHAIVPPLVPTVVLPVLNALIGKGRFPIDAFSPILYAYLYYIPIMAINGVTESFIASVASTQDLARQSRAMVLFSIVFLASSWGLLKVLEMGGEGLVWANCINMGVRIIWSCQFIETWYTTRSENFGWFRLLPSRRTLVSATGISLMVRMLCAWGLNGFIEATCVAGVASLILLCCIAYFEGDFLRTLYNMYNFRSKID